MVLMQEMARHSYLPIKCETGFVSAIHRLTKSIKVS